MQQINALPDHDYISEIKALMRDHRWNEAETLCEDVIKTQLPSAPQAQQLLTECKSESQKFQSRIYKAAKAFISGSPDSSIEELSGSIIADMLLYGDIRDLAMQGYFKITSKETDPVIASLAAAGIATEFIDIADWAPAALKAFRKLGLLSNRFAEAVQAIAKKIVQTGKLDLAAKSFFSNLSAMLNKAGFIRTGNMIRYVDTPEDLSKVAHHIIQNPHSTYLLSRHAKNNTVQTLQKLDNLPDAPQIKKHLIQKGARSLKYLARIGKTLHKGHLQRLLAILLGKYRIATAVLLLLAGVFQLGWGIKKLYASRQKKSVENTA